MILMLGLNLCEEEDVLEKVAILHSFGVMVRSWFSQL